MEQARLATAGVFSRLSTSSTSSSSSSSSSSTNCYDLPPFEKHPALSRRYSLRRLTRPFRSAKWHVVILLVVLTTIITFYLASPLILDGQDPLMLPSSSSIITKPDFENFNVSRPANDTGGYRRLRVFMPADSPHINLCKSIMSAVALGYPLPTLLNWHGEFNRPEWHLAGSHIAKLESLLSVIEELLDDADKNGDASEDDLAVMVDAYDIWFQLPPSVLIERFHQINREADERVKRQWQDAQGFATNFPIPPPRQSIVVTSAKHCSPRSDSGSDPHYEHWPESPMPSDMYGVTTDQVPFSLDPARKYQKVRPRCINSGMIMGTMGSLRKALRRCQEKIDQVARGGRQLWSDQALLGEVVGDQEMWREWMRELGATWNGTVSVNNPSKLHKDVQYIAKDALRGQNFEFGIGLDYNFTTIPATCSAEEDGDFVKLDDDKAVQKASSKAGVPGGVRTSGIPFELRRQLENNDPLVDVKWGRVPLYTDFYFGATPVGIHHNAYVENLKPWRLQHWWTKMWFHPQLRSLVLENLLSSDAHKERTLAKLSSPSGDGDQLIYMAPKLSSDKKVTVFQSQSGTSAARFTPIEWDGVCQKGPTPWFEELFGDGNGPLFLF